MLLILLLTLQTGIIIDFVIISFYHLDLNNFTICIIISFTDVSTVILTAILHFQLKY